VQYELTEDHTRVAATLYRLGDPAQALPHFREARDLRRELGETAAGHPDLASFPPAQQHAIRAQLVQDLARSNLAVGEMSIHLGDTAAGLECYALVLALRQKTYDASPQNLYNKFELARTFGNFGDNQLAVGNVAEAASHYEQAIAHMRELTKADLNNVQYRRDLGLAHYRLGHLALHRGEKVAADEHFAQALEVRQLLADNDPANDRRQLELMLALAHCKQTDRAAALAAKYRQRPKADNELLLDVARCYAVCATHSEEPARASHFANEALEALTEAVANGYKNRSFLKNGTDLNSVRDLPGFRELLERLPPTKVTPPPQP
jgi:tetratricopeptide (TPR) repeat protein